MKPLIASIVLALCVGASAAQAATADLTTFIGSGSAVVTADSAQLLANFLLESSSISGNVTGLTSFEYRYAAEMNYAGYAGYSTMNGATILATVTNTGADTGWKTVDLSQPYTGMLSFANRASFSLTSSATLSIRNLQLAAVIPPVTAPVPEPESYAMLLAGLGLMGALARKRGRRIAAVVSAARNSRAFG